ncbi:ROK family transcriptional regulator [Acidobacteria bacterium AB60]|nr:ROK family transcriptional regulator [Acidobacteria bacterium AB60]
MRGVASSETAREINRDILLYTIHHHQPVSRADLARLTGLQASTVSSIIGQLIEEGWVLPGTLGRLPRGRRPTFVTLNDKHVMLGIDLRPGKASLALVDINGNLLNRESLTFSSSNQPSDAKKAVQQLCKTARSMRSSCRGKLFDGVGVSVSGRVDQGTHRVLFSPNAPWAQIDVYEQFQKVIGGTIEMDNAANTCIFAERWFGEFRGATNLMTISISEGLGTGLVVDGHLLRGGGGIAGEFGHMPFDESGPPCGCGNVGCWETQASNRAALRYYHELVPENTLSSFQQLLDLAETGDPRALQAIERMTAALARGMAILVAGLAPEVISIVGECTAMWPRMWPIIESHLIAKSFTARIPRVVAAGDGDVARIRGAAAMVLHKKLFRRRDLEFLPNSVASQMDG